MLPSIPYYTYHVHTVLPYIQEHMRISRLRDDIELYSRMDIFVYNLDHMIPPGNLKKDILESTDTSQKIRI